MHAVCGYPEEVARLDSLRHAMITTILAVDLGKFNSVLCWYESASRVVPNRSHHAGRVASRTAAAARHAGAQAPGPLLGDLEERPALARAGVGRVTSGGDRERRVREGDDPRNYPGDPVDVGPASCIHLIGGS